MPSHQIYKIENNIGIYDTDSKKFEEGTCVAMSAIVCRNFLQGKRDLLTKPGGEQSGPLQAIYEIKFDCDYTNFLNSMSMNLDSTTTLNGTAAWTHLTQNSGQYMLRYPGHAMSARISVGHFYYFFDPDDGLYLYKTSAGFIKKIKKEYDGEKTSQWTLRKVSLQAN